MNAKYFSPIAPRPLSVLPSDSGATLAPPDGNQNAGIAGGKISTTDENLPATAGIVAQDVPVARFEPITVPGMSTSASIAIQTADGAQTSSHSETALGGRGEKFAALSDKIDNGEIPDGIAPGKTFLNALEKRVTSAETSLGIDGAKAPSAMSAATFFNHPAPVAMPVHGPVSAAVVAPAEFPSQSAPLPPGEAAGAAHRAVEAVLTAADRFSSGDRHAVNLQFSVGGADLSVRVELRADEVRTTFRTDSPELRAALTHEWQVVNTETSSDRSFRVSPPVFSATDSANLAAFSGDSAPRQRDSGNGRSVDETFATVVQRSRGTQTSTSASSEAMPLSPSLMSSGNALHLHTLA
jgi:hypothetical protein